MPEIIDLLKPCPFCGSAPNHPDIDMVICEGEDCPNTVAMMPEEWERRPIEDQLKEVIQLKNKRIAELEARLIDEKQQSVKAYKLANELRQACDSLAELERQRMYMPVEYMITRGSVWNTRDTEEIKP